MAPPADLVLNVVVLDTRTGAWCPRCLLPSAAEVEAVLVHHRTLARFGRVDAVVCLDCGHAAPGGG